ncbi:serine/threonine-protein kinase Nek11-like [Lithobates pipiens]
MEGTLNTTPVLCQSGFAAGSVIMKRYLLHQKLGSGSFATTYLVTDSRDADAQKVIKRIPCNSMKADATLPSAREAKLLGSLKHPFIVRFYASFLESEDFCIVTEYCEGGDLDCHLQQLKDRGLAMPEGHVMEWFIQLLLGVTYLHERLVLHRDLKTKNIFLKNGTLKIGDFGVSRVLVPSDLATTITGTASYMSPEIFTRNGYNSKSDIWSMGCILYELCTFRHVFDCPRWIKLVSMIVNDPCPNLPSRYSAELNDILQRMLSKDPELRPSAKDILNFPYVADRAKVLEEWLHGVLSEDRRVSVDDDVTRIAAAMQEKLHVDSLRVMRVVQEMPARQRRRIRQEERPESSMGKLKRAVERIYQENHQKLEDDRKYEDLKNAWMENEARLADEEQKDVLREEEESEEEESEEGEEEESEEGEEEESCAGSVMTLSLPLSEQQSNTLSAYRSCLRRFLESSMETPGIQDTISLDSGEVTLTVCSGEEIAFLRQSCIRLLGEDGFWEVYNYLKQVYNQQDLETIDLEEPTLCEPQVMKLYPHHCYKVQQLLFLEERMEKEPQNPHLSWL